MDKRIKAKWVKALRSGKYEQGFDMLRTEDGCYCCLGVLREILHEESTYTRRQLMDGRGYLSQRARALCGLEQDRERALARLNDFVGLAFDEIARKIQAHY